MKSNVVLFERGAEFYFDLGFKYVQKGKLNTALRYMEKAAGLKPSDSFILFNYAGLLAELGEVDRSSQVLLNIIKDLDPSYLECYFGLGCNYLQMQKIKKSVEFFKLYLEKDPDGEFSEEAEELLEMLTMIKDANNNLDDEELEKIYSIEEEAIHHLEKREYEKAAQKFEAVVEMLPNAIPARNNLALAYYYLGSFEKAVELAREVLTYEEGNVHANCNLAIFYNKMGVSSWVEKQLRIIKKLQTDNEDYLYKIADTLGSLGKHAEAYKAYKKVLTISPDNTLYTHYAAIAAYNCKRFKESIRLWESLSKLDNGDGIASYYIEAALKAAENEEGAVNLAYIYQLPRDEIKNRLDFIYKFIELPGSACREMIQGNDKALEILYFGINFDKCFLRKLIFNKLKNERLLETEPVLRKFIMQRDVENHVKMESIFLLNTIGAKEPYTVDFDGEIKNVSIDPLSFPEAEWKEDWEQVKRKALSMMKSCYSRPYKKIVEDIWYEFIKSTYPDVPETQETDTWAAALEYTYAALMGVGPGFADIAEKYAIPVSNLEEKYVRIHQIIGSKFILGKEKK